jgi:signal transduction histidine kinase
VIAFAMHAAYRQNAVDDLVTMAERHNVALAQSFANTLWSRYSSYVASVSLADGDTLRAHPETRTIHEALKTLTTELPVLKVKIYNIEGLTVYSSQPSQMGDDKSENPGFLSATLDGTPASKLSYRDSFSAFSSTVHDRDLVETYIPIRGAEGRIEGVFELYTDVTPLVAKIGTNSNLFFVGLLFSFGLLYAILFLIIRRADLILKTQYFDLRNNEERIKAKNVELEHEVTERMRVEEALQVSHDLLERRVQERTVELRENEQILQAQIADLEKAQRKLEIQGADLVRLADELLVARDEARAADRAKSEFLAAMSHELRTPLNAVIGFSEIITNETFGPVGSVKYCDYANDINQSGQHLLGLINDILDLSKIESGTDDLHEKRIEFSEIASAALKLVEQRANKGGIKLELELLDPLPALRADERKLKQILVNLLSNAVKFTDAGGAVTLRAWCRMDNGHAFQIVDTGIGIKSEDISKALSRFGQVDGDLNRQYEGTGLGLPLTKALVEQHGGTLELQSEAGVGTTVTVRFPAERIEELPRDTDIIDSAAKKVG